MAYRIEVFNKVEDARAKIRLNKFNQLPFAPKIKNLYLSDNYLIDKNLNSSQLNEVGNLLINPVTQKFFLSTKYRFSDYPDFDWAIEIGYLQGVTDNIGNTAGEMISDFLKTDSYNRQFVYTSQTSFIKGKLNLFDSKEMAENLYNPIIQTVKIKNKKQFQKDKGMGIKIPDVKLKKKRSVLKINLNVDDRELALIGKQGIANSDGTRRGTLALSLLYLEAIKVYFGTHQRKPTDIELESIAQTWSEHCKHTIFNSPLDEIKEGLFKKYIQGATDKIRKIKGKKDFCVSVFKDNSGAIAFDKKNLITHKVETHNSPSALDPFGGSITGIVGVNRDTIGFGLGAKPVANFYGFCLADPRVNITLYRQKGAKSPMLSSKRIMEGVIEGVNVGGNQSGIPTPLGFMFFDDRFRGKPLVFVGTVGIIPRELKGKKSFSKKARPGDYIVMIGGKVGKDGIHGATFSSEALGGTSPKTAVQIGDPITQKKLSDAIVKEARDIRLYNSITDNGAGGLSCSVAEMAKESNGCEVDIDDVPLKYPGLAPWEIWISESQERMTLAVPPAKWSKFQGLMKSRGVDAWKIGKFTDSGKCIVKFKKKIIMNIDLEFLHYGLPQKKLSSSYKKNKYPEPEMKNKINLTIDLLSLLERLNIASFSFISQQYDHLVQASSVLTSLQGRGRINADSVVFRPLLSSQRGVILSFGLYPTYSDIDTYQMAACSIDTAIRNAVALGADVNYLALLDNFCWCSSEDPQRLGQLKRAVKACYDYSLAFATPFISGKDSMFNDFQGFNQNGKPIKISIPPTLLISSIAVISDINKVVSLDAKKPGDLIYILGDTFDELAGSEYFLMTNGKSAKYDFGNKIPQVIASKNIKLYKAYFNCVQQNLIASAISLTRGGLGLSLAKMSMGGLLGVNINLKNLPGQFSRNDFSLFSESQGRFLVTISPQNKSKFREYLKGIPIAQIGEVTNDQKFIVRDKNNNTAVKTDIATLLKYYRKPFLGY